MKNALNAGLIAFVLPMAGSAYANQQAHDHEAAHGHTPNHIHESAQAGRSVELADGEIRKINSRGGTITVRHGEIKSVNMPPMTMVFEVPDPRMLDDLKAGDKVKFNVRQEAGRYILTEIRRAEP